MVAKKRFELIDDIVFWAKYIWSKWSGGEPMPEYVERLLYMRLYDYDDETLRHMGWDSVEDLLCNISGKVLRWVDKHT